MVAKSYVGAAPPGITKNGAGRLGGIYRYVRGEHLVTLMFILLILAGMREKPTPSHTPPHNLGSYRTLRACPTFTTTWF